MRVYEGQQKIRPPMPSGMAYKTDIYTNFVYQARWVWVATGGSVVGVGSVGSGPGVGDLHDAALDISLGGSGQYSISHSSDMPSRPCNDDAMMMHHAYTSWRIRKRCKQL